LFRREKEEPFVDKMEKRDKDRLTMGRSDLNVAKTGT